MVSLARLVTLTFVVAALMTARVARADGCIPGQVAAPTSDGHCCWPGQGWSDEYNRCTGAPQCPEGWYGSGSTCVSSPVAAPNPPPPIPFPAPAPTPPVTENPRAIDLQPPPAIAPGTSVPYDGGPIPNGTHIDVRRDKGYLIGGFVTLAVGYELASIMAAILIVDAPYSGSSCGINAGVGVIPVVGSALAGVLMSGNSECHFDTAGRSGLVAAGVFLSGVQVAGLIAGIYGIAHQNRFVVFDARSADNGKGGLQVAIVPGTAASPEGLSLVARF